MAMTTITLTGPLGRLYGRKIHLDVETPAEAIKALCRTRKGFEDTLLQTGLEFAVLKGNRELPLDGLHHSHGSKTVKIVCIPAGAKRGGLTQIFLGAALIAASFFTAGAAAAIGFSAAAAASAATAVFGMGLSMAVGGVVQMLSPQPKGMAMRQDADNKPSYAFGGPVNTTTMGNPVAVLYGLREVGGAIISAGIIAEDVRI